MTINGGGTNLKKWLDQVQEEPLEPDLPICDAHHHLWIHNDDQYLIDEFNQDIAGGHHIVRTVYVESWNFHHLNSGADASPVEETKFVVSQCRSNQSDCEIAAGIIGFADLRKGDAVPEIIEKHIEAGQGRFCGIRQSCPWDPHPEITMKEPSGYLMADPEFRKGLTLLEKYHLSFEIWIYYHQLMELVDLARAFPKIPIILNHIGTPIGFGPYSHKREQVLNEWRSAIEALAECPNTILKFGGFGMYVNGFGWDKRALPPGSAEIAESIRPYYEHCIKNFGSKRCMFESNFPVDRASYSYTVIWNAYKRLTRECSSEEKLDLFHDTAARVYQLPV